MNDKETRTPTELQEWLAQVEQRAAVGGPQIPRLWGGERNPVFDSIRTDIPRLVQELRRAWARIEEFKEALEWCGGSADFQPEGIAYEGWKRVVMPLLHPEQTQPKEGGGQDE